MKDFVYSLALLRLKDDVILCGINVESAAEDTKSL